MVTTHPEYSNNELFLIMLKNTFSVLTPKGPDVETLAVIHIEKGDPSKYYTSIFELRINFKKLQYNEKESVSPLKSDDEKIKDNFQ